MNNNGALINDIEVEIQLHKSKIERAKAEIKYHEDAILILEGKTEVCPYCDGEGKIMIVHRFMGPHKYISCRVCLGSGKVSKVAVHENRNE